MRDINLKENKINERIAANLTFHFIYLWQYSGQVCDMYGCKYKENKN